MGQSVLRWFLIGRRRKGSWLIFQHPRPVPTLRDRPGGSCQPVQASKLLEIRNGEKEVRRDGVSWPNPGAREKEDGWTVPRTDTGALAE